MSAAPKLDTKGFNLNIQFQNNLPSTHGHGLYAKVDFADFHPEDALRYGRRTSSLEKKHMWEASADPFCGMKINLVDQDKLLRHSTEPVDSADMKLLYSQKQSTSTLGNNGARGVTDDQKPYWLRNTTYLENNPFNKYSNNNEEEAFEAHRESRKRKVVEDIFSKEKVAQTFAKCEEVIKSEGGPRKKGKVVGVFPIVPDALLGVVSAVLVRFDEDLSSTLSSDKAANRHTMVVNTREPPARELGTKAGVFHSTVVTPARDQDEATEGITHQWFRDYRMEMHDANLDDSYLLIVDPQDKTARYLPVRTRTDMKRLEFQQSVPRDIDFRTDDV
eukprot:gene9047-6498_t